MTNDFSREPILIHPHHASGGARLAAAGRKVIPDEKENPQPLRDRRVPRRRSAQVASLTAEIEADTLATQAAEISRPTAAERLLRAVAANLEIADKSGENWLRVFVAVETAREIVAFCAPQAQPAQEPETPVLSRYAADIAALAAGEITEEQFCARQGRKPI